jgi:GrpB-like predicted nucleotidyltransferase (UPF0157 family)
MDAAAFVQWSDIRVRDHRPAGVAGPDEEWRKLLFVGKPEHREANVHVRAVGRANQRYALLFRDYLRAHPAAAAAYGQLKHRLAQLDVDRATYSETKDPACDLIIFAAEAWAQQTGWQPGVSDG